MADAQRAGQLQMMERQLAMQVRVITHVITDAELRLLASYAAHVACAQVAV